LSILLSYFCASDLVSRVVLLDVVAPQVVDPGQFLVIVAADGSELRRIVGRQLHNDSRDLQLLLPHICANEFDVCLDVLFAGNSRLSI